MATDKVGTTCAPAQPRDSSPESGPSSPPSFTPGDWKAEPVGLFWDIVADDPNWPFLREVAECVSTRDKDLLAASKDLYRALAQICALFTPEIIEEFDKFGVLNSIVLSTALTDAHAALKAARGEVQQ